MSKRNLVDTNLVIDLASCRLSTKISANTRKESTNRSISMDEVHNELLGNRYYRESVNERDAVFLAADFIRQSRKKVNLSQVELAKRIGVSQARISELESGRLKHGPSISVLSKVASACGGELELKIL